MFHGSLVALVTPMGETGVIDYEALERLIAWHINNETDGMVILGTTGESVTIEPRERKELITKVVKQVNHRVPVIVGTGGPSTQFAIDMSREAMELGADAVLIVTPYYNKPTQKGLYLHFEAISKAVPIPQILYNVPSRTGCDLLPETIKRLDAFSNIVALKEATPGIERLQSLLEADVHLDLLSGHDSSAVDFVLNGGKGVISVTANVVPKWMHDMMEAALLGHKEKAVQFNNKLLMLHERLFLESNPIPVKWALSKMGLIRTGIRLPLTPLDERYYAELEEAMRSLDILTD